MGFIQENPRAGQLTAPQKLVARLAGGRGPAEAFLRAVVPLLLEYEILVPVQFPIPPSEQVGGLQALQIDPRRICVRFTEEGYRCNACQAWRAYTLPTCPTPKCRTGNLVPARLDRGNYYVRLYLERPPGRLAIAEPTQIGGDQRTRRETDSGDRLTRLHTDAGAWRRYRSPTDRGATNAPPTPANYAQRVGRAGRRRASASSPPFVRAGPDRPRLGGPVVRGGTVQASRLRLDNRGS